MSYFSLDPGFQINITFDSLHKNRRNYVRWTAQDIIFQYSIGFMGSRSFPLALDKKWFGERPFSRKRSLSKPANTINILA